MGAAITTIQAPNFAGQPEAIAFLDLSGVGTGPFIPVFQAGQLYPTPPTPLPSAILAGDTYTSGPIPGLGFKAIAATVLSTQAGVMTIQRYIDQAGTVPIGSAEEQVITANVLASITINDGIPYGAFELSVSNPGGSNATITDAYILQGA